MSERDPEAWKRRIRRRSFIGIVGTAVWSAVRVLSNLGGAVAFISWLFAWRPAPVIVLSRGTSIPVESAAGVTPAPTVVRLLPNGGYIVT